MLFFSFDSATISYPYTRRTSNYIVSHSVMERESDIECDDDFLIIMADETDCSQIMEYRPNSKPEKKSTALKT